MPRGPAVTFRRFSIAEHLEQELGRFRVVVCLPVQLDRVECLFLLEKVGCVFAQKCFDLLEVVVLRQVHTGVPFVEGHTAIDGGLHVAGLEIRRDRVLADPHRREFIPDFLTRSTFTSPSTHVEEHVTFGQFADQILETGVISTLR